MKDLFYNKFMMADKIYDFNILLNFKRKAKMRYPVS